jgi:ABC-2 type transport system permease protein
MSTAANAYPAATSSVARTARIFRKEIKYEFLKLLRTKSFSLSVIGFPVMFYLLFGIANAHAFSHTVHIAKYLLGGYACFGLIGAALFGIGVGLANERASGWLEVKQASPMPPMAYLVAKCITAIAFGIIIVSILATLGVTLGGVHLAAAELAKMLGVAVVGSISFASMGLLLALLIPANAAPGIVNLIYLPMSFASGLWMPIESLPRFVQHIALVLPTYHLSQLMLTVFHYQDPNTLASHCSALFGFTLLMLGLSWLRFSRQQQQA